MDDSGAFFADPDEKYDVAILGRHLATGLLAAVLSRNGVRVLLVDGAQDAAQPAGETTVPYTAEVFFTLASRFGVPEIAALGLTSDLPAAVRSSSGVKHSLGFLYHAPGAEQNPRETVQFNVPGEHAEWHPYRPDVDEYARRIAVRHGTRTIRFRPTVVDVLPGKDDVAVQTSDGRLFRARCVVDGLGPGSPLLPRMAATAPASTRLRHRSRLISGHLRGVRPFEDCVDPSRYPGTTPWSKGTISHLFPGGWLQVVHFDNHPDASNPLCGVSLSVGPERFGDLSGDPAVAFRAVVDRFPSLRRSFADAIAVGDWSDDLDCASNVAGAASDRVFLFDRTATRNDMFLSRDVTMGAELVLALAPVLIRAAATDDWSAERFQPVARFQTALAQLNDRFLVAARTAGCDFMLWNAFSRVWLLWSILAALSLKRIRNDCLRGDDWAAASRMTEGPYWFALPAGLPDLLDDTFALIEEVGRDEVMPRAAAGRIFKALARAPFVPPLYRFHAPEDRYYTFSVRKRLRMLVWSKTAAPPEFRAMLTRENVTSTRPAAGTNASLRD